MKNNMVFQMKLIIIIVVFQNLIGSTSSLDKLDFKNFSSLSCESKGTNENRFTL